MIEGDGIGREVVPEGIRVLEAAARRFDISFSCQHFDWNCEAYLKTGRMMPADGLDQLRPFDAIYLGAIGYPGVPDHHSLRQPNLSDLVRPMRLNHLGEPKAARAVEQAILRVLANSCGLAISSETRARGR